MSELSNEEKAVLARARERLEPGAARLARVHARVLAATGAPAPGAPAALEAAVRSTLRWRHGWFASAVATPSLALVAWLALRAPSAPHTVPDSVSAAPRAVRGEDHIAEAAAPLVSPPEPKGASDALDGRTPSQALRRAAAPRARVDRPHPAPAARSRRSADPAPAAAPRATPAPAVLAAPARPSTSAAQDPSAASASHTRPSTSAAQAPYAAPAAHDRPSTSVAHEPSSSSVAHEPSSSSVARDEAAARDDFAARDGDAPDLPAARHGRPPRQVRSEVTAREESAEDPLAAEVALIGAARRALLRNEAALAARGLREHAARYPRGQLEAERLSLEVRLACLTGDRAQARLRTEELARLAPTSALLQAAHEACDSTLEPGR